MTDQLSGKPRCPNRACNRVLDGFSAADKSAGGPRKGDLSVCAYCTQLLQFDGRRFEKATNEILNRLTKSEREDLERMQTLARFIKKRGLLDNKKFH